jgi:hypothetical protein
VAIKTREVSGCAAPKSLALSDFGRTALSGTPLVCTRGGHGCEEAIMRDHRQPVWAFLVIFLWLGAGVMLIISLGTDTGTFFLKVVVGTFVAVTLVMARAVHVLMDRDEKELPGWAMVVLTVLTVLIVAALGMR